MKGNDAVIAKLNEALREELTAINQYFVHAEMCHNWGYHRLGNYIKKQSIGEMKHAEEILERILFLDGIPSMQPLPLTIGSDVQGPARKRSEARAEGDRHVQRVRQGWPARRATTVRRTCSSACSRTRRNTSTSSRRRCTRSGSSATSGISGSSSTAAKTSNAPRTTRHEDAESPLWLVVITGP